MQRCAPIEMPAMAPVERGFLVGSAVVETNSVVVVTVVDVVVVLLRSHATAMQCKVSNISEW